MMFNDTTGRYNGSWPHSNQKDFNECDLDMDDLLSRAEVEACYDSRCVNSCRDYNDRYWRTDDWCECRSNTYDIIFDQFDTDKDESVSLAEFNLIYTSDTDTVNIDFSQSRITVSFTYYP